MNKLTDILTVVLGIAGFVLVFLLWAVAVLCSVLTTVAVAAVAGDLLGLWEVVGFV